MRKVRAWKQALPMGVTIQDKYISGVKVSEDQEQERLFYLIDLYAKAYPELSYIYHVPNQGTGSAVRGLKHKRMGVRAGVWDIAYDGVGINFCQDKSSDGTFVWQYSRFRIEMKVGNNGLSEDQLRWAKHYLSLPGQSRLAVCYSALDAFSVICDYFGILFEGGL